MRNRFRKFGESDINLTPLLDVLFVILFIVMLGGMESESKMRDEAQQEIDALTQENEALEAQLKELALDMDERQQASDAREREYVHRIDSYELYREQAVILAVHVEERNGIRELVIMDDLGQSRIQISEDLQTFVEERLRSTVQSYAASADAPEDARPIFVVFNYEPDGIYTFEIRMIDRIMTKLQEEYKEVFYKSLRSAETGVSAQSDQVAD